MGCPFVRLCPFIPDPEFAPLLPYNVNNSIATRDLESVSKFHYFNLICKRGSVRSSCPFDIFSFSFLAYHNFPFHCGDFRAQSGRCGSGSAQLWTQPAGWLSHHPSKSEVVVVLDFEIRISRFSTLALMIMILFRNYPLSFTEWKRAICAAVVPENGIISLLIMMTYDFHCQIC